MNGKIALQLLCLLAVGSGGACIKTRPPPPPRTTSTSLSSVPPSTFIVPGEFPTSVFSRYYNNPTQTVSQVQPVISDPVNVRNNSSRNEVSPNLAIIYLRTSFIRLS